MLIGEQIGARARDDDGVAAREVGHLAAVGRAARGDPAGLVARAVEDLVVVGEHDHAAAAALEAAFRGAAAPVEDERRDPTLGHDESVLRRQERALQGQPAVLGHVAALARRLAGRGVDGAQVARLPGQQRGAEVGRAVGDQHARPHGPSGDEPAVVEHPPRVWRGAEGPEALPILQREAVGRAVVTADVELAVGDGRRNAHRAIGVRDPALSGRLHVDAAHSIVDRRAEVDGVAHGDDMEHRVVVAHRPQAAQILVGIPLGRPGPRGPRRMGRLPHPLLPQLRRVDALGRVAAAAMVVAAGRPVLGADGRPRQQHGKSARYDSHDDTPCGASLEGLYRFSSCVHASSQTARD